MREGQILVADHQGVYVIKLTGDVRLTLCISFDAFIERMFGDPSFVSVVFDLIEAQAIDSTTLGLMAKISLMAQERFRLVPTLVSNNPSIDRILQTMGFSEIFCIVKEGDADIRGAEALCADCADEGEVKQRVLEAHKILVGLNATNQEAFKDLIASLEDD
ncbi:STAS domain-containing protein [Simiduia agarivorans]|uniref:Anti-anti-sigma factor n=1 Tax=Simiduia agarivorans (strain DSM 21679 / JCM 13881 / BCRC 17597 / SA1) TaxID=1117647 RepID=K4KP82_SIMAS|nr:STAS domain-containing protein [Simiduia agarivorans]AFV00832.1 anti-anti-sigma factor [Simiduia agarivorans SA1 = DSM 21679]